MTRRTHRGGIALITLSGLAIVTIAGAFVAGLATSSTSSTSLVANKSSVRVRLSTPGVQAWLVRVGLTPKALAAAGVSAGATTTLVGDAVDHLAQHMGELTEADEARTLARREVARLEQLVMSGQPSEGNLSALSAARTTLTSAETQLATASQALFADATNGLTEGQRTTIQAIQANGHRSVPTEFMVSTRTDAQWVALRDALASKRIAIREGHEPSQGVLDVISGATDQATSTAAANLASLNAVNTAWDDATDEAEGR